MLRLTCCLLAICLTAPASLAQGPAPQLPPPVSPHPGVWGRSAPEAASEAEPWLPEPPGADDHHGAAASCEEEWPRFAARADYLLWWFRHTPLPPVLTTADTTDALPGALGMPTTTVLFPRGSVDEGLHSGARWLAPYRLGAEGGLGVEAGGFFLASRSLLYTAPSDRTAQSGIVGRPFFNLGTGENDVSLTAFPGVATGVAHVGVTSRLWGAEANGLATLYRCRGLRVDGVVGFRYFRLYEAVTMDEQTTVLPGVPGLGGAVIAGVDDFAVANNFYGGQLGARAELRNGGLSVSVEAKVALGATQEVVSVGGQTTQPGPDGTAQTFPGHLYALSSNLGRHTRSSFAVLPEAGVSLGWQVLEHVGLRAGYTFLYLSRVARPGEQIDTGLNPGLIPTSVFYGTAGGPARPAVPFRESDFWVQGVHAGVEITY